MCSEDKVNIVSVASKVGYVTELNEGGYLSSTQSDNFPSLVSACNTLLLSVDLANEYVVYGKDQKPDEILESMENSLYVMLENDKSFFSDEDSYEALDDLIGYLKEIKEGIVLDDQD